ncbi:MAG: hypothetical protein L6R42_006711 [Xanthoria sp. 1 TBL-2021]|nr:MAG: hypothetical protein L6R42_006711 [Xanthoria sp. 1 TBL-2021]
MTARTLVQNPGGSSSGSAVAVSAVLSPFALGTEKQGSLIMPGNRAALYTMKPTVGIVSQQTSSPYLTYRDEFEDSYKKH